MMLLWVSCEKTIACYGRVANARDIFKVSESYCTCAGFSLSIRS